MNWDTQLKRYIKTINFIAVSNPGANLEQKESRNVLNCDHIAEAII